MDKLKRFADPGKTMDKLKPCPFSPEWLRSVPNYEGIYWVTQAGEIINRKGVVLKPYDNGYGYLIVDLRKGKSKKHIRVHRIVAEAFIKNPDNLPEVNHKDENKHNNSVRNLEWCTSSYNKQYGNGRKARSDGMKKVWETRRASDE